MRMSTRGRYTLRAMVDLALHQGEGPVQREDIAGRQEIPSPYLARLMAEMVRAGLVRGERGPGGGYSLARPAAEISAGEIVRAVEGPLALAPCLQEGAELSCSYQAHCAASMLWQKLDRAIAQALDEVTLENLYLEAKQLGAVPKYDH